MTELTGSTRSLGETASIGSGISYGYRAVPESTSGAINIPSTLGGHPVTGIGNYAFEDCSGLTSVTIPDSVASIGRRAFLNCSSLTSVTIPNSVTSIGDRGFADCNALTNVTISESVTTIGELAFSSCSSLKALTIPESVTTIGREAFSACYSLAYVAILGNVTNEWPYYGDDGYHTGYLFEYCTNLETVVLGPKMTKIGARMFYRCSKLKEVVIPDGVTSIGRDAFRNCSCLTNLTLGNSVTNIGHYAFDECSGLTVLTLPKSVKFIGQGAFSGWSGLKNVTIPENMEVLMDSAFSHCTGLTNVALLCNANLDGTFFDGPFVDCPNLTTAVFGDTVSQIGKYVFNGCNGLTEVVIPDHVKSIGKRAFSACSNMTKLVLGNGVESIREEAFSHCRGLTEVTLPESVSYLGWNAFSACSGLKRMTILGNITNDWGLKSMPFGNTSLDSVVFGNKAGKIGDYMFYTCKLSTVSIGNSVTNIGSYAFYGCTNLTSVDIPDGVTSIGRYAFSGCTGLLRLEVPVAWYGTTMFANADVPDGCRIVYRGMASETVDGVTWHYIVGDNASVVLNGDYAGELSVPEMLGEYPVASIGVGTFSGCTNLTALVIPDCVESVGRNAFTGCGELSALEVPAAWYGTTMLANAGVPDGCRVAYRGIEAMAVTTEALPEGTVGSAYAATLEATGGMVPYTWSNPTGGYLESAMKSTYTATGTAQGWQSDDSCWKLALPFAFPFFGKTYTSAKINSNGAISFGTDDFKAYSYSADTFLASPIIAVLWKDLNTSSGDIHVESTADAVTIRWEGVYYNSTEVAFSATLRVGGTIILSYGEGNANGGVIGISAGDGVTSLLSAKNDSGSMSNADDIVFAVLSDLPSGMSLSKEGVISGTPVAAGTNTFTVVVTDVAGVTATKDLTLVVAESGDAEETSSGVPYAWLDVHGFGDGTTTGYEAAASTNAANHAYKVWECYVAGLDPTNPAARFTAELAFSNGTPVVSWTPDLNKKNIKPERSYVLEGTPTLTNAWGPTNADSRFFRVKVALP